MRDHPSGKALATSRSFFDRRVTVGLLEAGERPSRGHGSGTSKDASTKLKGD